MRPWRIWITFLLGEMMLSRQKKVGRWSPGLKVLIDDSDTVGLADRLPPRGLKNDRGHAILPV